MRGGGWKHVLSLLLQRSKWVWWCDAVRLVHALPHRLLCLLLICPVASLFKVCQPKVPLSWDGGLVNSVLTQVHGHLNSRCLQLWNNHWLDDHPNEKLSSCSCWFQTCIYVFNKNNWKLGYYWLKLQIIMHQTRLILKTY